MGKVVGADVDRPLRADEGEGEVGLLQPGLADAGEEPDRSVGQPVHRFDGIAGDRPEPLGALHGIRLRDRPAVARDRGLAPAGGPAEIGHHVEDVATEHPQILAAAPRILLAAAPELEEPADSAILDEIADDRVGGAVAVDHRQGELRSRGTAGGDDRVGLGGRAHEGLLQKDPLHPRLRGGDRHLRMAVDVAHAERDDLRFDLREHRAPVAKTRRGAPGSAAEPLDGLAEAVGRFVGHGDELRPLDRGPQFVDRVPPVAPSRPADDRDAQRLLCHCLTSSHDVVPRTAGCCRGPSGSV